MGVKWNFRSCASPWRVRVRVRVSDREREEGERVRGCESCRNKDKILRTTTVLLQRLRNKVAVLDRHIPSERTKLQNSKFFTFLRERERKKNRLSLFEKRLWAVCECAQPFQCVVAVVVLHRHNITTFPASHPGPFVRSLSGSGRRQHRTPMQRREKSQQKKLGEKKSVPLPLKNF